MSSEKEARKGIDSQTRSQGDEERIIILNDLPVSSLQIPMPPVKSNEHISANPSDSSRSSNRSSNGPSNSASANSEGESK